MNYGNAQNSKLSRGSTDGLLNAPSNHDIINQIQKTKAARSANRRTAVR